MNEYSAIALGLGEQKDVPLTEEEKRVLLNKKAMEVSGYRISPGIPWRRYFARSFDMQLAIAIIAAPMFLAVIHLIRSPEMDFYFYPDQVFWFLGLLASVIYLFIEAYIIKKTGTTFGKFCLGIRIFTTGYDRNYTYRQLLKRNFLMFLKGFGLNIPIANIIAMIVAKQHVNGDAEGQSSWDFDCDIFVAYKELRGINTFLIIVNLLISAAIIVVSAL